MTRARAQLGTARCDVRINRVGPNYLSNKYDTTQIIINTKINELARPV